MENFHAPHDGDPVPEQYPSSSAARIGTRQLLLKRAIVAAVSGDVTDIDRFYTRDVVGSGPSTSARCREELAIEIEERAAALSQTEVTVAHIELRCEYARINWEASALHTGLLVLESNGAVLEPTGLRLRVKAVTIARFRGEQICWWRSDWRDVTLTAGNC